MKFAMSKAGIVVIPVLTAAIAGALSKYVPPEYASQVKADELAGWVWGVVLALISGYALKQQGDGVVKIQAAMDMTPVVGEVSQDRYAGPKLYAEVRRAIAVAESK